MDDGALKKDIQRRATSRGCKPLPQDLVSPSNAQDWVYVSGLETPPTALSELQSKLKKGA